MKYRGLLLVMLALVLLPAAPAAACEPVEAGYYLNWYTVNLRVDPSPLPVNVTVAGLYSESIIVRNTGTTPLYVIAPASQADLDQPLALPAGWSAIYKLEHGALFTWVDGRWISDGRTTEAILKLDAAAISPPLAVSTPSGPNRPAAGPEPVPARLSLLYDNERLDVPIALDYSLNPHYDPAKYERIMGESCNVGSLGTFIFQLLMGLIVCLFVLAFSALAIWFVRSAPKPPATQ